MPRSTVADGRQGLTFIDDLWVETSDGTKMRDRMRSIQRNVMRIGRAARIKGERGKKALAVIYRKVLATTGRVTAQARRFSGEIAGGVKRSSDFLKQAALHGLKAPSPFRPCPARSDCRGRKGARV